MSTRSITDANHEGSELPVKKDDSHRDDDVEQARFDAADVAPQTAVKPVKDVARSSRDSDLSINDIFDETKTARENKSLLASYELERMGMGRYQWFVFGLCGGGYFIDLMWAQAISLIATPLKNEPSFGANTSTISTLSTAFNVGLAVGAFTWGLLVDIIGRKWSFYFTCLIAGIFGIASGGSNSFLTLRCLISVAGFGIGGNVPIDATITLEILPTNRRFLLAALSVFQPLGVLVATGIAYGFIPSHTCAGGAMAVANPATCTKNANAGWRYLLYTLGSITIFVFLLRFVVFTFYESPAFLINRGQDKDAINTVAAIAKLNRAPPPQFTIEDFEEIDRRCSRKSATTIDEAGKSDHETSHSIKETYTQFVRRTLVAFVTQFKQLRLLFRNFTMARLTILLWVTYIADFFGFNIASFYLPQILADRGASNNTSLSETYRDYVAIYAPGIVACVLGAMLIEIPRLGRQWSMVFASALMAVSMFLYTTVSTQAASVGLNFLEYFMQSLFNAVLYAYTPEAYPSAIRGTASGFTSTLGRIAGIIAPIAGGSLYGSGGTSQADRVQASKNVLYLGGGITLLCPVALALLPFDSRGVRSY